MGVWRRASPRLRRGPIAASLARAVMSEPEKPVIVDDHVSIVDKEVEWGIMMMIELPSVT